MAEPIIVPLVRGATHWRNILESGPDGEAEMELSDLIDTARYISETFNSSSSETVLEKINAKVIRAISKIERMRWNNLLGSGKQLSDNDAGYEQGIRELRILVARYPEETRNSAMQAIHDGRLLQKSDATDDSEPRYDADMLYDEEEQLLLGSESSKTGEARLLTLSESSNDEKVWDNALDAIEKAINDGDTERSQSNKGEKLKAPVAPSPLPRRFIYDRVKTASEVTSSVQMVPGSGKKRAGDRAVERAAGSGKKRAGEGVARKDESGHSSTSVQNAVSVKPKGRRYSKDERAKRDIVAANKERKVDEKKERFDALMRVTNEHRGEKGGAPLSKEQFVWLINEWNKFTTGPENTDFARKVSGGLSKKELLDCYHQDPHSEFASPHGYGRMYKYATEGATKKWPFKYSSERLTEADRRDHPERFNDSEGKGPVYASIGKAGSPGFVHFPNFASQYLSDEGNDEDGVPWKTPKTNRGLSRGRSDQSIHWSAFAQYFEATHERLITMAHLGYENFKNSHGGRTVAAKEQVQQAIEAMRAASVPGATEEQKKAVEEAKQGAFWVHSPDYVDIQGFLDSFDFQSAPEQRLMRYDQANKLRQFLGNGMGAQAWFRFVDWYTTTPSEDKAAVSTIKAGDMITIITKGDVEIEFPFYSDKDGNDRCKQLYVSLAALAGMIFDDTEFPPPPTAGKNYNRSIPKEQGDFYDYKSAIDACKKLVTLLESYKDKGEEEVRATEDEEEEAVRATEDVAEAMFGVAHGNRLHLYPWLKHELNLDHEIDTADAAIVALKKKIHNDEIEMDHQEQFESWIEVAKGRHEINLRIMAGFRIPVPNSDAHRIPVPNSDAHRNAWEYAGMSTFWQVIQRDFYPVWRRRNDETTLVQSDPPNKKRAVLRGLGRIEGMFPHEWFDKKHFDEFDPYGHLKWEKSPVERGRGKRDQPKTPHHFDYAHRKAMSPDLYTLMKRRYTEEMLSDETNEATDSDNRVNLTEEDYYNLFYPGRIGHLTLGKDRRDKVHRRTYGAGAYNPHPVKNERDFGRERGPWVMVPGDSASNIKPKPSPKPKTGEQEGRGEEEKGGWTPTEERDLAFLLGKQTSPTFWADVTLMFPNRTNEEVIARMHTRKASDQQPVRSNEFTNAAHKHKKKKTLALSTQLSVASSGFIPRLHMTLRCRLNAAMHGLQL